jgi:hypothetical protein
MIFLTYHGYRLAGHAWLEQQGTSAHTSSFEGLKPLWEFMYNFSVAPKGVMILISLESV